MILKMNIPFREHFFNALCNGVSNSYSSFTIDYDREKQDQYRAAAALAKGDANKVCREDIWMAVLDAGDELIFIDCYDDEEYKLSLAQIETNIQKIPDAAPWALKNILKQNDDVIDADAVMQVIVLGEVVYG